VIEVIDDDFGRSAAGDIQRAGFERMVAEVSFGKVGAVCAREVSRFARNSRDWKQLIEMCLAVDTVLVDQETIYAPRHGNDCLLLGLKGSLDEYEPIYSPALAPGSLSQEMGRAAAVTTHLIKTSHLTVNRVPGFRDNCRAILWTLHHVVPQSTKASAANVRIGLPMIEHSTEGLLFLERGREFPIVAYGVSRTHARLHADGLGLLPINFYITFDRFLTVGKCRLVWRWRDDIGVEFERWIDIGQRGAVEEAGTGVCGDHRHR
jgi:hypothetical protein